MKNLPEQPYLQLLLLRETKSIVWKIKNQQQLKVGI